jgi:hypothetical protein
MEIAMEDNSKNMKSVYTIIDRGQGKSYWVRVGVGFTNRDGSLNIRLDAVPVNGTLQVREWEPYERRPEIADPPIRARSATRDSASDALLEG